MRTVQTYTPELKIYALSLRGRGYTYAEIINEIREKFNLIIPKNTISDWCSTSGIKLNPNQIKRIRQSQKEHLRQAQQKGGQYHAKQKLIRLQEAKMKAHTFLQELNPAQNHKFLFLSGLYLGEGSKDDIRMLFANSNPTIIEAFMKIFRLMFSIEEKRFSAQLLLRYDQDENQLKAFWSNITQISIDRFQKVQKDKRTRFSATYENYKGVCCVYYSDSSIQRFLIELQQQYMDLVIHDKMPMESVNI